MESWRYAAPFLTLIVLLGLAGYLPLPGSWAYPLRTVAVALVTLICSRRLVTLRASRLPASIAVGVAVFVIWIGPDLLWPGYRHSWLFENGLTGSVNYSVPSPEYRSALFLFFRISGSALLVPVVEELFWRGYLMRRLIASDIHKVPLGAYRAGAFWITAALFASEHGAYWDVGLAAGIIYNGWLVRTRNLADCIVAHAVTNACLAAYVLAAGAWQYWL